MTSPMAALLGNIIHAFENPNGSAVNLLRHAVSQGLVSDALDMLLDQTKPMAPRVIRPKDGAAIIQLHIVHMELLWAFIYGWLVLYEEGVQGPMLEGTFDGRIHLNNALKLRAAQLLDWASGLKDQYTSWPRNLSSPTYFESLEEQSYALKTNNIFQQSAAFLLFHEFGHVRQEHFNAIDHRDTVEARTASIELEREADDFAFRVLVSTDDDEETRRVKAWAILAPALSSLYLVNGPVEIFQKRHPHLHHRVADLLGKLNFHEDRNKDYFNYLCATVLLLIGRAHESQGDAAITPRIFETALDALQDELDALDALDPGALR